MHRFVRSTLALCLATFAVSTPAFADSATPSVGGSGGTTFFNNTCPVWAPHVTGVQVRAGAYIDNIFGTCNGGAAFTASAGGGGGSPQVRNCPSGYVMTGWFPKSGGLVDGAFFLCTPTNNVRAGTTIGEMTLNYVGGSGGSFGNVYRCPPTEAVKGFYGVHGDYIDRMGLICGPVP